MSQSAPHDTTHAPRHERLFELLRQQSLANERYFPSPAHESEIAALSAADFQHLAQASLYPGRSAR